MNKREARGCSSSHCAAWSSTRRANRSRTAAAMTSLIMALMRKAALRARRHGQIAKGVVRVDVHLQQPDRSYFLRRGEARQALGIDAEIVVAGAADGYHEDRSRLHAVPRRSGKLIATQCRGTGAVCALLLRECGDALSGVPSDGVRLPVSSVTVGDSEMIQRCGQLCGITVVRTIEQRCGHPRDADRIDQDEAADPHGGDPREDSRP